MQIEAGKYYRTRDGHKAGPMREYEPGRNLWADGSHIYEPTGRHGDASDTLVELRAIKNRPGLDIIAEWVDQPAGPVRTRTVTEIVPGTYGLIRCGEIEASRFVRLGLDRELFNAAELRAAAAVFVQLADALEAAE